LAGEFPGPGLSALLFGPPMHPRSDPTRTPGSEPVPLGGTAPRLWQDLAAMRRRARADV
jgi:hypothetical protein